MPKYCSYKEGDRIQAYTLSQALGDGRFGIVFGAIKDGDDTPKYAIKIPRHFSEAVESIADEVRALCLEHPAPGIRIS